MIVLLLINCFIEEAQVCSSSFNIFFDLIPEILILKKLVPLAVVACAQRVINQNLLAGCFQFFCCLDCGLYNEFIFPNIVGL
jgi:hypothetical protein